MIVALNKFKGDSKKEIDALTSHCKEKDIKAFTIDCFGRGRDGGDEVAQYIKQSFKTANFAPKEKYLYPLKSTVRSKVEAIAKNIYRANDVVFTKEAEATLKIIEVSPYRDFPVCVAKNQYSFTDDEKKLGAPTGHTFHINDLKVYAGSGFITIYAGKIFTMPGLSRTPALERIDVDSKGNITGLR